MHGVRAQPHEPRGLSEPIGTGVAKAKYAVELKAGVNSAQFQVGGREVELNEDNPRFETDDRRVYEGIRGLPFLKEAGESKPPKGGAE